MPNNYYIQHTEVDSALLSCHYNTLLITSHSSNNGLTLQLLYFLYYDTSWKMPKICMFLIVWIYGRFFPKIFPLKSGHVFHSIVPYSQEYDVYVCMYVCCSFCVGDRCLIKAADNFWHNTDWFYLLKTHILILLKYYTLLL